MAQVDSPALAIAGTLTDYPKASNTYRIVRYCVVITVFAMACTIAIILALNSDGMEKLQEWLVEAILAPILIAPPVAYLGMKRKIEIEQLNAKLQHALDHDHLTKTNTRQSLIQHYRHATTESALVMVDADHFKFINDRFGHIVGDQALCHLADAMRAHIRHGDMVSRFGGEEFVLLLHDVTLHQAVEICERLRAHLNRTFLDHPTAEISVTVSMGVAMCLEGEPIDQALARADAAVYRAKEKGRNRVQVADMPPPPASKGQAA